VSRSSASNAAPLAQQGKTGRAIWTGFFAGVREGSESRDSISTSACFQTERQCRRWLYEMRSEYSLMTLRDECVRGGA
jgi:hypothetical protein